MKNLPKKQPVTELADEFSKVNLSDETAVKEPEKSIQPVDKLAATKFVCELCYAAYKTEGYF